MIVRTIARVQHPTANRDRAIQFRSARLILVSFSRRLAAIDIGTSSVHLAIAQPVPGARPEIILREKLPVRLGSGATDMKSLNPEAVDRAIEALRTFRALADANDADTHAVATSAVREAEHPDEFLRRAKIEAGITVEVISGVEEARLIHLGVLGALPIADTSHLVIDIGGGSTEIIVGSGVQPTLLRSLKIGHVRLTDRFFPDGTIDDGSIDTCRKFIRSFLAEISSTLGNHEFTIVAGSSGTFETLTAIARRGSSSRSAAKPITRAEIAEATKLVCSKTTSVKRETIKGLEPHRADTIVAGALLVEELMDSIGFDEFVLSPDALREGLVLDRLDRRDPSPGTLHHLNEIRSSSVETMAERYGENVVHARQATDIALSLFDATAALHGYEDDERDVLEAAAMLHNIGRFVGHGAHHKHSYYLIRNGEQLAGFNEHERELIALVARYHRKSAPKPAHEPFSALAKTDQRLVSTLAGMLRIGIALDRTYRNVATDIEVRMNETEIEVLVDGFGLELELFAANERKRLLEDSLERSISVKRSATSSSSSFEAEAELSSPRL